jgi:hypothetical protein
MRMYWRRGRSLWIYLRTRHTLIVEKTPPLPAPPSRSAPASEKVVFAVPRTERREAAIHKDSPALSHR